MKVRRKNQIYNFKFETEPSYGSGEAKLKPVFLILNDEFLIKNSFKSRFLNTHEMILSYNSQNSALPPLTLTDNYQLLCSKQEKKPKPDSRHILPCTPAATLY